MPFQFSAPAYRNARAGIQECRNAGMRAPTYRNAGVALRDPKPNRAGGFTRGRKDWQFCCAGFLLPCKATKRRMALCHASFGNEAGRRKVKQETARIFDLGYSEQKHRDGRGDRPNKPKWCLQNLLSQDRFWRPEKPPLLALHSAGGVARRERFDLPYAHLVEVELDGVLEARRRRREFHSVLAVEPVCQRVYQARAE